MLAGSESWLLVHQRIRKRPRIKLSTHQSSIACKGKPALFATEKDLSIYCQTYEQHLPAIFVPNWSDAAYYACTLVATRHPSKIRIIGVAHADDDYYYDLLCRYEPSIHIFIAVSKTIALKLSNLLPHRAHDIHHRVYFVDSIQPYQPKPTTAFVITYSGRLEQEQKRVTDLLDVLRILNLSGLECKINIVGDGECLPWLRSQVQNLIYESCCEITFHGVVTHSKMLALWSQSHIMLQCSAYEGASISMLEAMASGCVPVVTAVSGALDLINHGENGFLSPVGDPSSLAESILKLAADPQLFYNTSRNAYQSVKELCSRDTYAEWFLSLEQILWSMNDRSYQPDFSLPVSNSAQNPARSSVFTYLRKLLNTVTRR